MENVPSSEVKQEAKGEVQAKKEPQKGLMDFQDQITGLISLAGTIEATEDQKKILYAPVKEEDVEIRPDGLVYLPWMEYVSRLKDSFGMSWAIIPQGPPKVQDNHVMWAFWLIIQGKPAGFAIGEQEYYPNNRQMTYGDALEGAKSNALMRLCKGIGISLELWRPSFVRAWKSKHAESYEDYGRDGKKRILWRKKGNHVSEPEKSKENPSKTQETPLKQDFDFLKASGEAKKQLKALTGKDEAYYQTLAAWQYNHANEVKEEDRIGVLDDLRETYKALKAEVGKEDKK